MMYSSYISSFLVVLISVNLTTGLSCSWWRWCPDTSNNIAITTKKPSMTTQAGSYCKCDSSPWDRQERIRLVTGLMRVAFQTITNDARYITSLFNLKSNSNKNFELNDSLTSFANSASQPDVFAFLLAGGLFTTAWDQITRDYNLSNGTLLTTVFSQLYVYPLANALQSIAIEHGTSIGVFRAGQIEKYDGVCSLVSDTGNPSSNLTGYLWQQQCNINLMYLVGFSLNSSCFNGTSDEIFLPTNIETAFDNHFISNYPRFVRSAIISYSNATASMDVLVGLYFKSNESLWSIDGVLQNMSRINGTYCGGVYVASTQFVLVNCTWYSPENLTRVCTNTNGINPIVPRSSSTLTETTIITTQTTLAETTVATTPLVTPSTQATSITETSSTTLITAPTTVPPISSTAPSTLSTTPYESSLPLSSTQQSVDGITTTATTSENQSLSTNLTDSNKSTSPSLQANAIDVSTSSPNTTVKELSSTTTPGSGQNAVSSVPQSQVTNNVNGNTTTMATTISDKNATTYDPDPLFKAMAPLMTKKYNDPLLLRQVGTMSPVTSNTNFYWVTIPICICAIVLSVLCLLCLQVDWLMVCSKKQDSKKLIN